jgi:hypothetical protein
VTETDIISFSVLRFDILKIKTSFFHFPVGFCSFLIWIFLILDLLKMDFHDASTFKDVMGFTASSNDVFYEDDAADTSIPDIQVNLFYSLFEIIGWYIQ